MGFVAWIATGFVIGLITKLLKGARGGVGDWMSYLLLGVAGAVLGGFIYSLFSWGALRSVSPGSLVLAAAFAVLTVAGYRAMEREPRWS